MAKRDYYDVLGVRRGATNEQIKSAYRKLARKYHPDVNKAADASQRFHEATEAYEVLSDPEKRKMYDQFGHAGPGAGPGAGRGRAWSPAGDGGVPFDFEEMFGGAGGGGHGFLRMSLDEILSALRGGGRRSRRKAPPARGRDLEHHVTLEFLEAVHGTTTRLRLQRQDERGRTHSQTIDVKIPPGVRDGARVRLRGKGAEGAGGAGDLYIVCHVRPHPYFRREGSDIYIDVPVSITEAALGAKVDVPTIDGMTTVTVPPGTGGSRRLRLKGKGLRSAAGDGRGDQYVVVKVVPPPKLSEDGAKLLRQFDAVEKFDPREGVPW